MAKLKLEYLLIIALRKVLARRKAYGMKQSGMTEAAS